LSEARVIRGTLLLESLRPDASITGFSFSVSEVGRGRPKLSLEQVRAGIPSVWSAIEFEVSEERGPELATVLSNALEDGWYANFSSDRETFVVYRGRIFRYPRKDARGRSEAQAYGRTLGIPDHQLDWSE
jgi:hypothetical protein